MTTYGSQIRNGTGFFSLELRQVSQDIANNTSTVSYRLYISGDSGYGFWNELNSGKTSLTINGSLVHNQSGRNFNIRNGGTQQLASGTTVVRHNEDGSKSFSFSASLWSTSATGKLTGTFTLSSIPRASDFRVTNSDGASISSFYAGQYIKIGIDKKVSKFKHTVAVRYLDKEEVIADKSSATSIDYGDSKKIAESYMKDVASMGVSFIVYTYDDGRLIGSFSKRLTINTPKDVVPVISSVDVSEANENKAKVIGSFPFYQHLSSLRIRTSAYARLGASIKSVRVSLGDFVRTGSDVRFDGVNLTGSQTIKVEVRDSRDLSVTFEKKIDLKPYKLPNISLFNSYRVEGNKKFAYARLALESTVIDNKNPLDVKVDVSEKDANSWKNVYSATVGNGSFNSTVPLGGGFDEFKAYDVRASITDKFKRHTALATIAAATQSLVIGASSPVVGVGRVPEISEGLEVRGLVQVEGDSQNKINIKGTSSKGALIEWFIDGKESAWIGSWGNALNFGGASVYFREGVFVDKIMPWDAAKTYDAELNTGISGWAKMKKDPLGNVHLWGEIILGSKAATNRWYTWWTCSDEYKPERAVAIPFFDGSNIINGLVMTSGGVVTWVAESGNQTILITGKNYTFDCLYRAGDSPW